MAPCQLATVSPCTVSWFIVVDWRRTTTIVGVEKVDFKYLLDKIQASDIRGEPFNYLCIEDFLTPEHFSAITNASQIKIPSASNDGDMFDLLFDAGYQVLEFGGCVTDKDQYIKWHEKRAVSHITSTTCEGFGMTLRLSNIENPIISEFSAFFESDIFKSVISEKFNINTNTVYLDSGIQKYLDGYEISPHPDRRRKALTFMLNINPNAHSDECEHHTHYMRFKPPYKYVQTFWEGNHDMERCWVPWDWCETVFQQRANNSIVIFSPGDASLHAVKANYDHLPSQRTQMYGNLWYPEDGLDALLTWEDFVITPSETSEGPVSRIKSLIPEGTKAAIKTLPIVNRLFAKTDGRILRSPERQ
jgi:hypothetical protein